MSNLNPNHVELQIHPACLIMPEMDSDDYAKLKEDISGFGLRYPITLFQGMILDGRHRYRACLELGIEPEFTTWQGGSSVVEFVLGENLYRRHLSSGQKAMVATKAMEYHKKEALKRMGDKTKRINNDLLDFSKEETEQGSAPGALPSDSNVIEFPVENGKATAAAAKAVGVSARTVERAVFVKEHGTPEDVKDVEQGHVSLKAKAAEVAARKAPKSITENAIRIEQWEAMETDARARALATPTDKKLNTQDNDSIDWAAYSWNPITGCNHGCDYCYARDIANRFYGELGFNPAFYPERLLIPFNHKVASGSKNNRIFTCSMSDLFGAWVPVEWINAILDVCKENPAFEFLLLTKNPRRLTEFAFPRNCWVGTTTDTQQRMNAAERIFQDVDATVKWVSVEPMLEPIVPSDASRFDWYVIGGATPSTGHPGFVPPAAWVFRLAHLAYEAKRSVFIKANFWSTGRPKEFPQQTPVA
jgi:protein gp37